MATNGRNGKKGANGAQGPLGAISRLEVDDPSVSALLEAMHGLLLTHKYECAQQAALGQLMACVPEAGGCAPGSGHGKTDEAPGLSPAALEALDELLALHEMHVQEAMLVGYLLGSLHTRITTFVSVDKVALQIVRGLGLEEAMEANLGYGVRLTKKALDKDAARGQR